MNEPTTEAKNVCSEMPVVVCAVPAPPSSAPLMLVGLAIIDEDEAVDMVIMGDQKFLYL